VSNRRRHRRNRRHKSNRRRHRRNGRSFRRNPTGFLVDLLKAGATITVGVVAEKLLAGVIRDQVLARITGKAETATPAAASGLEMLQPYNGLISSFIAAFGGAYVTHKVVKNPQTKALIMGGLGAGFVHSVLMFALDKLNQPKLAMMLSGDGTAARIAAMYGLGAGASIMPRYAPAAGIGEYFANNGVGEYFASGVNGLGAYTSNPDLLQAAAGMGAMEAANTNHISPSSNLDRELSIAEAAAGIGAVKSYEAAAGMGEYFASGMSGLGATVPSTSTWIPGQAVPQLWAGTRTAGQSQAAHEMLPAGVLETSGGQGIFG
jgi:hypothetical protein